MYQRQNASQPPSALLPGQGRAYENLGRTNFTTRSSRAATKGTADGTVDEFDFLSPSSTPPPTGFTDEHGHGDLGQHYEKKAFDLKNMKFKKKSSTAGGSATKEPALTKEAPNFDISFAAFVDASQAGPSGLRAGETRSEPRPRPISISDDSPASQPPPKPRPKALGMTARPRAAFGRSKLISSTPNPLPPSARAPILPALSPDTSVELEVLPARLTRSAKSNTAAMPISLSSSQSEDIVEVPAPAGAPPRAEAFPVSTPPPVKKAAAAYPNLSPLKSPSSDHLDLPPSDKGKVKQAATFPGLSPLKSQSSDVSETRQQKKGKGKETAAFPLSPPGSPRSSLAGPPTSLPSSAERDKGKQRAAEPTSPVARSRPKPRPRPVKKAKEKVPKAFPMSTQALTEAGRSNHTDDGYSSPGDPLAGDFDFGSSDVDDGRGSMNDLFLDPNIDPATLCPYCDQLLPEEPTARLIDLLKAVFKKSRQDPRPSNPLGRTAPVSLFVNACQRHRFESESLPRAKEQHWPTEIDFKAVRRRVEALEPELQGVIDGLASDPEDVEDPDVTITVSPLRRRSSFWEEIVAEVRQVGTNAATGVGAQFWSFEKTRPGYYGEVGALIIQQTLFNLFPPGAIAARRIAPLTHGEFIQRVLVPEAAIALIGADLRQGRAAARETLRASAQYGVALFPDDTRSRGASEADRMMRQRASARRRELAADLLPPSHSGAETDTSGVGHALRPGKREPVMRSASDMSAASRPPRPKRHKTPADVIELSDSDAPPAPREPLVKSRAGNSLDTPQAARPPPRPRIKDGTATDRGDTGHDAENAHAGNAGDADSGSDMDIEVLEVKERQHLASVASVVVPFEKTNARGKKSAPAPAPFPMDLDSPPKPGRPISIPGSSRRTEQAWSRTMCDDPGTASEGYHSGASLDISDVDMRSRKAKDGKKDNSWLFSDDSDQE